MGRPVRASHATRNAFGLVSQGVSGPAIAAGNIAAGNGLDVLTDGNLGVPDQAMAIPETPDLD